MDGPTLQSADAGQAFEMIRPERIERALRIIFRLIQLKTGKDDPTISCMHSTKAKARFGGWVRDVLHDRSCYFMSKVASCVRSLPKLRIFRFGSKLIVQLSGIPIGGPISGAALEAVLCVDEYMFDR